MMFMPVCVEFKNIPPVGFNAKIYSPGGAAGSCSNTPIHGWLARLRNGFYKLTRKNHSHLLNGMLDA